MPGPLPNPQRRRRNAPTVPTTRIPATGRQGRPPKPPHQLGPAGSAWWQWAWRLPQACAWSAGDLYALARRAGLEDDLEALALPDDLDLAELLDVGEEQREVLRRLEAVIWRLKALAGGRVSVMREMRELDNRFGLNPKALADLRWTIEAPPQDEEAAPVAAAHVRAVDPAAA